MQQNRLLVTNTPAAAPLAGTVQERMIQTPEIYSLLEIYIAYSIYLERIATGAHPTVSGTFVSAIHRAVDSLRHQIKMVSWRIFASFESGWLDEIRWILVRRTPQGEQFFLNKVPFRK